MAQLFAVEVTLTGTAIVLSTPITAFDHVEKIIITPDPANTHVVTVLYGSIVVKSIAKPSAADAVMDEFRLEAAAGNNEFPLAQLKVNGTSGEKCRVLVVVQ